MHYVKCSLNYALVDCVCSLMTKINLCYYYYFIFKYISFTKTITPKVQKRGFYVLVVA